MRGGGGETGDVSVPPDTTVDSRPAPIAQDVSSPDEEDIAEPQFAEAIPADEFAALQRRRESIRAARKAAADNRQNFLDSIDLSFLTEGQRKTHVAYADARTRAWLSPPLIGIGNKIPPYHLFRFIKIEGVKPCPGLGNEDELRTFAICGIVQGF